MEDKYKSYTVPELASDDSFILWTLRGENDQFWSQWLYANPDKTKTDTEGEDCGAVVPVANETTEPFANSF